MTRLLPRLPRRATAETDPAAGPATAPAAEQPTAVSVEGVPLPGEPPLAPRTPPRRGPSHTAPAGDGHRPRRHRPGGAARARLPRARPPAPPRALFLRRVRELGFRDLGGLVFDQHRFGRPEPALVTQKVTALAAVDGELRAIEAALGAGRP